MSQTTVIARKADPEGLLEGIHGIVHRVRLGLRVGAWTEVVCAGKGGAVDPVLQVALVHERPAAVDCQTGHPEEGNSRDGKDHEHLTLEPASSSSNHQYSVDMVAEDSR